MYNIEISTQKSAITRTVTFPAYWSARQRVPAVSGEAAASGGGAMQASLPQWAVGDRLPSDMPPIAA